MVKIPKKEIKAKNKVTLFYTGTLMTEQEEADVQTTDPKQFNCPKKAFAFQFSSIHYCEVDFEGKIRILRNTQKKSPMYYPNAEVFTIGDLENMNTFSDLDILISNIKCNSKDAVPRAIRCQCGNWQVFEEGMTEIV